MKLLILLALVAVAAAHPDGYYDAKYENMNVDEILGNTRLLQNYAHCFLGDGKCTAEGKELRELIPEATKTECAKCTEKQKVLVAKCINGIKKDLPTEFAALVKQHDPEHKYQDKLENFLGKYST